MQNIIQKYIFIGLALSFSTSASALSETLDCSVAQYEELAKIHSDYFEEIEGVEYIQNSEYYNDWLEAFEELEFEGTTPSIVIAERNGTRLWRYDCEGAKCTKEEFNDFAYRSCRDNYDVISGVKRIPDPNCVNLAVRINNQNYCLALDVSEYPKITPQQENQNLTEDKMEAQEAFSCSANEFFENKAEFDDYFYSSLSFFSAATSEIHEKIVDNIAQQVPSKSPTIITADLDGGEVFRYKCKGENCGSEEMFQKAIIECVSKTGKQCLPAAVEVNEKRLCLLGEAP